MVLGMAFYLIDWQAETRFMAFLLCSSAVMSIFMGRDASVSP